MTELNKILYVEDEPDIQAVARIALETVGQLTLEICSSGQEALDKAAAFDPDLILLDVMMPGLDGPDTLLELRKLDGFSSKPVIFMTAKVMDSEVQRYLDLGAIGVIPKPFDPMGLAGQVKSIWQDSHG
ncbi:MAG: response regulator [Alphaproteobacteria bacterium]|jgi:two-component system, OmpR family, response regulator|nr:response regulator [Alphaproteobacteria bacterium]